MRHTSFHGVVIPGNKRGRLLGFPTANIPLTLPIPEGIYAATVELQGKSFQGATFIGPSKTYNETDYKSETFIFDFEKDIYGEELSITLHKKIRGNKKFSSEKELIEQMKKDISAISSFFDQTDN